MAIGHLNSGQPGYDGGFADLVVTKQDDTKQPVWLWTTKLALDHSPSAATAPGYGNHVGVFCVSAEVLRDSFVGMYVVCC